MASLGLTLALAFVVVVGWFIYHRFDERLRREVERRLAAHYDELEVRLGAARWIQGQGIELRRLVVLERGAVGPQSELLAVDEVLVRCPAELQDLVHGLPPISELVVRRPVVRMTRRPEGRWSASKLLPLPFLSDSYPRIVIENATLAVFDPLKNPSSNLMLRDAQLILTPSEAALRGQPGPDDHYLIEGHLSADYVRQIDVRGKLSLSGDRLDVAGAIESLDVCPEFHACLPGSVAEPLESLSGLKAHAKLGYQIVADRRDETAIRFRFDGTISRGRLDDARLPFPLSDVQAHVTCDEQGVRVSELSARNGPASFWMELEQQGYGPQATRGIRAAARKMPLDRRMLTMESIPAEWRAEWSKYLPSGEVDLDFRGRFDGDNWHPDEIVARCEDVAFTYSKFPYRLERTRGTIEYRDDQLRVSLRAYSADEEVRIGGQWNQATQGGAGWLKFAADRMPLDEKLLAALPTATGNVIRQLEPRGVLKVDALFQQDAGHWNAPPKYQVTLGVEHGSIRYDGFAYPLENVRGTVRIDDGVWSFENFSGANDTARVECNGRLEPVPQGHMLVLGFSGENVPLEDELRDAVQDPRLRNLWNEFKPKGAVRLKSQVSWISGQPNLNIWARVWPLPGQTSIEPSYFPYRLENLGGELFFQDRHVDFRRLTAEHGPTRLVEASGSCSLGPDGGWQLQMQKLVIDRLQADRDLSRALPARMRETVRQLDPRGWISLAGGVELFQGPERASPVSARWNLQVDFQDASLACGRPLEKIQGAVAFQGDFSEGRLHAHGELDVDSLILDGTQFTQLQGPLWMDDNRLLLGGLADRPAPGQPPRHLTAEVCGGTVLADVGLTLGDGQDFRIDATLSQVDLAELTRSFSSAPDRLDGKLAGQIHLAGRGSARHTIAGFGNLQLREADVYASPLMVRLLRVLSVRPPDRSAFTECDVDYRIEAGHVYFDRIDFKGDAITLRGKGEMNLDTDLNLDFFAMVGREQMHLPLIGGVLRGASQQILQIHVDGRLNDPNIERRTLPGVKRGLEQLGIEIGRANDRPRVPIDPRTIPAPLPRPRADYTPPKLN